MIHAPCRWLVRLFMPASLSFVAGCMCMGGSRLMGHPSSSHASHHEGCMPMGHSGSGKSGTTGIEPSSRPATAPEAHETGEATKHELH